MKRVVIALLLFFVLTSLTVAQTGRPRVPTFSPDNGVIPRGATAGELAAAMDIPASLVVSASLGTSSPKGTHAFGFELSGFPTKNESFATISSGNAKDAQLANTSPSLSTTLDGLDTELEEDLVQLKLTLKVPTNATFWALDFKFLSEEYPEYVNSQFNDAFFIETPSSTFVIDENGDVSAPNNVAFDPEGNPVTINATGPTGMSAGNANGTTYDGATGSLIAFAPISAGSSEVKIIFSVMDIGDSAYDTTVFLDNFRFITGDTPPGDSQPPVFNEPPTPANGAVFRADIGEEISFDLQATDPDAADTVTLSLLEPVTGAVITSTPANPVNGTFSWTPAAGQEGVYVILLVATDNNGAVSSPQSIVLVAGNIPPDAVADAYTTSANSDLNVFAPGVLSNDSDVNEDALTVNTEPVEATYGGTISLDADGGFSYSPDANFIGVDTFTYEVSDGEFTDTARAVITVGTNLLLNGGFETQGFNKQNASSWTLKQPNGDARICDKPAKEKFYAHTGQCAFVFTGNVGTNTGLVQSVTLFAGVSGDLAILNTWIRAESLSTGGRVKVVIKLESGAKDKIIHDILDGSYEYTPTGDQVALTGTPTKLKVKIGMKNGSGKFYIDDIVIGILPPVPTAATIPLPASGLTSK